MAILVEVIIFGCFYLFSRNVLVVIYTFILQPNVIHYKDRSRPTDLGWDAVYWSPPRYFHSFIFIRVLPQARFAGAEATRGIKLSHGFQQSLILLIAAHQEGIKQDRGFNQATWSMLDHRAACPWLQPAGRASPIFSGEFLSGGRTIVAEISSFGDVARHSGLYEFHNCALCREVSHRELVAKIPSLPLALEIAIFHWLHKIHVHRRSEQRLI